MTLVANTLKRAGEIRLLEHCAGCGCLVGSLKINALRFWIHRQALGSRSQAHIQRKRGIEALFSKINRRLNHCGEGQLPVLSLRMNQASDGTWNTSRLTREISLCLVDGAVGIEKHIAAGSSRCSFAIIDKDLLIGFGEVDQHKASATQVACTGQGDGQCEACCHRSIDRITALFEHVETNFSRQFFGAHHHTDAAIVGQLGMLVIDDRRIGSNQWRRSLLRQGQRRE